MIKIVRPVKLIQRGGNNNIQIGHLTIQNVNNYDIELDGNDITQVANLYQLCTELELFPKVDIEGIMNHTNSKGTFSANFLSSYINMYVRSVIVHSETKNLSVGGSNASLQDIAAYKFTIHLKANEYYTLQELYPTLALYRNSDNRDEFSNLIKTLDLEPTENNIDLVIALVKNKKTKNEIDILINILSDFKSFSTNSIAKIAECFRCLYLPAFRDNSLQYTMQTVLENFIYKAFNTPYQKAVIYAVESIGAITNSIEGKKIAERVVGFLVKNSDKWESSVAREHLIWATLSKIKTANLQYNTDLRKILTTEKFTEIPSIVIN